MCWQRTSRFIFCLLLLSAAACGQGSDDNTDGAVSTTPPADTDDPPLDGSVVINDDVDRALALQESDAYELETDGARAPVIENDTLSLTVSYGGGCETHEFILVTDGSFMESDPVKLNVTLTHNANDDPCEAYPTERYSFDLAPIKTLYREAYGTDEGSVILRLWHLPHPRHSGTPGVVERVYNFAP